MQMPKPRRIPPMQEIMDMPLEKLADIPETGTEECDHDYQYNRMYKDWRCTRCDEYPPADWFDRFADGSD
jgi:hypothetical protein